MMILIVVEPSDGQARPDPTRTHQLTHRSVVASMYYLLVVR